jgi:hypothetical protein
MTKTRVVLNVSLLVAAFIVAQNLVLTIWGLVFDAANPGTLTNVVTNDPNIVQALFWAAGNEIVFALSFGVGVFVALRFVRPVWGSLGWRATIVRAVIATAFATAAVLAMRLIETLISTLHVGQHPFGYSLDLTVQPNNVGESLFNAFGELLNPFVDNLPLVVLACVFLRLWLNRPTKVEPLFADAKVHASRVG